MDQNINKNSANNIHSNNTQNLNFIYTKSTTNNLPIIELKNVSFSYNNKKIDLNNCNFIINKGDFHAFIGENGAGKTTIIKLLTGLIVKFDGKIKINNLDINQNILARNGLSYVPDKTIFPNHWNTKRFLIESVRLVRRGSTIKLEIDNLLKQMDLSEIAKRNPNKLSSGQKKKILLVKAILEKAKIIILDEPAANLDPTSRMQLFSILRALNKNGVTIFISSHILNEIKDYVNAATIISKGKILFTGQIYGNELVQKYQKYVLSNADFSKKMEFINY